MWADRILAQVDRAAELPKALAELMAQQRATWPALAAGEVALADTPVRVLASGDAGLLAQANLRRSASTFARTDAESIARRPCFLCEANLPPEERGIAFDDLIIMPNPFPAVPEHLTLAARDHVPQSLSGRIPTLLRSARALREDYFVLYNGPRCGASAPDHFHFQAGRRALMPVFGHAQLECGESARILSAGARSFVRVRGSSADRVEQQIEEAVSRLATLDDEPPEPKINLLATYRGGHYVVLIFPRTQHRPANFFEPEASLSISPASLEMAGLVVVCDEGVFERVTANDVEAILREVCVDKAALVRAGLAP